MRKILFFICCVVFANTAYACDTNQIDVDGTCINGKFAVKTTNLNANDEFKFTMSARGTFTVDCGTDGTLTSDANDITNGNTITRTSTTVTIYTCAYDTGGAKIITFDGGATGYASSMQNAAIRFTTKTYQPSSTESLTPTRIASVSGNLATLFPVLGTGSTQQPHFSYTFFGATNLTTIPDTLFTGYTRGPTYMFYNTFWRCTKLTSIPAGLFSGITTGATGMFAGTFEDCTDLTSIPPSTFAGLIVNNVPTATDMWSNTFTNTKIAKSCPAGTVQFTTGYEDYWGGRVSCVDENLVCGAGEYLPQHWFQCEKCPENNYCVGGTYPYNETNASGAVSCASGLFAPAGMWESAQCGRILHIGDQVVYLRSVKKTVPSVNVDIDNDGIPDYFGNMTTLDVPMTNGTQRKLKLSYGGQTYSVYDDSVDLWLYQP